MQEEKSSFRDPVSKVFNNGNNIYREIYPPYFNEYNKLMNKGLYDELTDCNLLIPHSLIGSRIDKITIIPRMITFISYPYEWCFSMLKSAALNTLAINRIAMEHGMMLKDASAYNMQWDHGSMVLIDTCSFMTYEAGMPWGAYRQFLQHFLYPLVLMAYKDASFGKLSQSYMDGIRAKLAIKLLPGKLRFHPGMLAHVYAQSLNFTVNPNRKVIMSRMALDALLNNLFNLIRSLEYKTRSDWTNYSDGDSYSPAAKKSKDNIIVNLSSKYLYNRVDLGCNTGEYSRSALLAVDSDHDCIEYVFEKREDNLPLIIDLCNPTPAIGWGNTERKSFWDRVHVENIMALALIHHLCVGNNVPLSYVAELFSQHCKNLIIEFVPLEDPKAKLLLGKKNIPPYSLEIFKSEFSKWFNIVGEYPIEDSLRTIYVMERIWGN
ncbi:MAG: hypothetical protein PHQ86_01885 [Dehalococcoidales bacterium]|nr:hypothetical protein [Dehalococcoidales bacterium]